jgi:hypothetical protein
MYYWIQLSEDGDYFIRYHEDASEVLEDIALANDGVKPEHQITFIDYIPELDKPRFAAKGNEVCLIKGEIIIPKPVQVTTEWKLP